MAAVFEGAATGIGSWPGQDVREAVLAVRDTLPDLPHLPELPARGPGAEIIGRGAALLVSLPVELQPHGWRLVDHEGRDAHRAASYLRADIDALAEAYDGYTGPLKLQVTGPWTLAASLWLARGERALTDPGARRDLVASLADGVRAHVSVARGAVAGAQLVVQVDEPSLPAVLAGRLPRASGYGLVRAVDQAEVEQGLAAVVTAVREAGATPVVHSCAAELPLELLQRVGADALSLDLSLLSARDWERLAPGLESGLGLWAGVVPTRPGHGSDAEPTGLPAVSTLLDAVRRPWRGLGLPVEGIGRVVVTPTCGLSGASPAQAVAALTRAVAAGRALAEAAQDG